MQAHTIEARTHGRYLVEPGPEERLLVGFHGYAESAETHLRELLRIPGVERWTVVSVQALNRFYTRAQDVVANWMTSQDREGAIADNVDYVRAVVAAFPPPASLVFAGFSQGAAMAWRAAAAHPGASGVVVVGGDLPPDVAPPLPPALIARGEHDEWYSAEKFAADLARLAGGEVATLVHGGGHEWTDEVREAVAAFLRR